MGTGVLSIVSIQVSINSPIKNNQMFKSMYALIEIYILIDIFSFYRKPTCLQCLHVLHCSGKLVFAEQGYFL